MIIGNNFNNNNNFNNKNTIKENNKVLNNNNFNNQLLKNANTLNTKEMNDKSFIMLQDRLNKGLISIEEFNRQCNLIKKRNE